MAKVPKYNWEELFPIGVWVQHVPSEYWGTVVAHDEAGPRVRYKDGTEHIYPNGFELALEEYENEHPAKAEGRHNAQF